MVNKVASQTDLIDQSELTLLQNIQLHRHLSAHPVMTNQDVLFTPNKETARAYIRNALEAVLTKPPIMSRKVFDVFIEDIEQLAKLQPDIEGLNRYLEAKFFRYFSPAAFQQIFKSLWRIIFRSNDARCAANRSINLAALRIMFGRRRDALLAAIKQEREWFSDVAVLAEPLESLIMFCHEYQQVYPALTDAAKLPIEKLAQSKLTVFLSCTFASASLQSHAETALARLQGGESVDANALKKFVDSLPDGIQKSAFVRYGMAHYFASGSFDTADERFATHVAPFVESYVRDDIVAFMEGCATCTRGQATYRSGAEEDHAIIKNIIDKRFPDIRVSDYPAFEKSLS